MEVRADSPPRVLADRYEVGELLGAGGMAHVYRAHDRILERPVAIKILNAPLAADDRVLRSFVREARAAAALTHPNAVTVFDTGVDDDQHYILMELVEGETLKQVLAREHRLAPERARRIAIDVARALTAAHGRGLVHRDVKPGNVLIGEDGRPRVADFGIACPSEHADDGRTVLGTAAYLSPEQARGQPTTPASDVYSLGCVLYEMLTGRRPFTGDTPVSVAVKHLRHAPPPVEAVAPDVPPALAAVVHRAMQKEPRRRYPDAGAMLAALEGAATTRGLPERRRPRRLRRMAATLLLAVVAVLAPALLASGGGPPEPGERVAAGERQKATRVEVPSVQGMTQERAGRVLRRRGLVPIFRGAPLDGEAPSVVATQDPAPGTKLAEGSFVTMELVAAGVGEAAGVPAGSTNRGSASEQAEGQGRPASEERDREEPSPSHSPSPTPTPTPTPSPSPSPTPTEGVR